MPDEIGWPTPEEEAILDRIAARIAAERAKRPADEIEAEGRELSRRSAAAKRYRLEQAASLPASADDHEGADHQVPSERKDRTENADHIVNDAGAERAPNDAKRAQQVMNSNCASDILNLLAAGEPFSLGQLNRLLGSRWKQNDLTAHLSLLIDRGQILQSSRVDYVRGGRLTIATYMIRENG